MYISCQLLVSKKLKIKIMLGYRKYILCEIIIKPFDIRKNMLVFCWFLFFEIGCNSEKSMIISLHVLNTTDCKK